MRRTVHLLKGTVTSIIKVGKFELGLMYQSLIQREIFQSIILPRGLELILCIFQRVVGNEMMLYTVDGHCHRLLQ